MRLTELVANLHGATSVEEATTAVRALQRELELTRIEMVRQDTLGVGEIGLHTLMVEPERRERMVLWKARLSVQLAGYNGCRAISAEGRPTLLLVGRERWAKAVRIIFLVLVNLIESFCERRRMEDPACAGEKNNYGFRNDAVAKISLAMTQGVDDARAGVDPTLLVKLDEELRNVAGWIKENVSLGWTR